MSAKLRHEWWWSDTDRAYTCKVCGQRGICKEEGKWFSMGGAVVPDLPTVDPFFCAGEPSDTQADRSEALPPLNINVVENDDGTDEIVDAEARSGEEVFHKALVGSDGRIALQFTKPVTFYTMEPHEAFDMAQLLLKAAYESRARKEGMITGKLGPHVIVDEKGKPISP